MADIPQTYTFYQGENAEKVMEITIIVSSEQLSILEDFEWDSKTGAVTALNKNTQKRVLIPYSGNSTGTLKPERFSCDNIRSVEYDLLYY